MLPDHQLDVEYDFVGIIDGLPPDERTQYRISKELMDFLAASGVQQQCAECGTKKGFRTALEHFAKRAESGDLFCLHIVCHGNKDGLGVKATGEFVRWVEFKETLNRINKAMKDRLTINMSSCKGLHGIQIVDADGKDLPFFGLVGPKDDLETDDAKEINRRYYELQLTGKEIQEVVTEINKFYGKEKIYCVSAKVYRHAQLLRRSTGHGGTLSF